MIILKVNKKTDKPKLQDTNLLNSGEKGEYHVLEQKRKRRVPSFLGNFPIFPAVQFPDAHFRTFEQTLMREQLSGFVKLWNGVFAL